MKVRVSMGRTVREYATVIVEAESIEAATAYCERVLGADDYAEEYCELVNAGNWESEADSVSEEGVIDADEWEDADDEADVVVPAAAAGGGQ